MMMMMSRGLLRHHRRRGRSPPCRCHPPPRRRPPRRRRRCPWRFSTISLGRAGTRMTRWRERPARRGRSSARWKFWKELVRNPRPPGEYCRDWPRAAENIWFEVTLYHSRARIVLAHSPRNGVFYIQTSVPGSGPRATPLSERFYLENARFLTKPKRQTSNAHMIDR